MKNFWFILNRFLAANEVGAGLIFVPAGICYGGSDVSQSLWLRLTVYVLDMHNPSTDVEFDPVKAILNHAKHGVRFAQAEEALRDPMAITIEDLCALDEQRFVTLGMDAGGRILAVVHTPRGDRTRLISARKASKGEAGKYHAQGI